MEINIAELIAILNSSGVSQEVYDATNEELLRRLNPPVVREQYEVNQPHNDPDPSWTVPDEREQQQFPFSHQARGWRSAKPSIGEQQIETD